jgi:hypothetical protein
MSWTLIKSYLIDSKEFSGKPIFLNEKKELLKKLFIDLELSF